MSKKANPATIGLFVIVAVILAFAAVLVLGSGKFMEDAQTYVLYFEGDLNGLDVGAPVTSRGVKVGEVTSVSIVYDHETLSIVTPVLIKIRPGAYVEVNGADEVLDYRQAADYYAGKDVVNPGSLLFSGVMMLEYIGWKEAAALVIENADTVAGDTAAETALFHLHNHMTGRGGLLLLTAARAPRDWGLTLPDLQSRMEATATATLLPPDDALLGAVLVKLFADRQLQVAPGFIRWLVRRIDRSFATARAVVAALDAEALATKRPINSTLAAGLLDSDGKVAP